MGLPLLYNSGVVAKRRCDITNIPKFMWIKNLSYSTLSPLRKYVLNVYHQQNSLTSSFLRIILITTKQELILPPTREWDHSGHLGLDPVQNVLPIKHQSNWWWLLILENMLRSMMLLMFIRHQGICKWNINVSNNNWKETKRS